MRPNSSMPLAAASRACPSFVTSNGSLSDREWSAMDEGSRAVATTASPLVRTASMIRAPNPRDAPVMNQVFMCLLVRSTEIGEIGRIAGSVEVGFVDQDASGTTSGAISHYGAK